jgi:hypothetical protein
MIVFYVPTPCGIGRLSRVLSWCLGHFRDRCKLHTLHSLVSRFAFIVFHLFTAHCPSVFKKQPQPLVCDPYYPFWCRSKP